MMRPALLIAALCLASPAVAQQNQVPGDTNAGGNSSEVSGMTAAHAAQAGADTSDATTTGASGPANRKAAKPAAVALPPLPSEKLCSTYSGDVQAACLSTVTNKGAAP